MRRFLVVFLVITVLINGGLVAYEHLYPHEAAAFLINAARDKADLHEAKTSIPGFEISYLEGGRGDALVLLHGFSASKDNWTPVARYLTPNYHVVIPDLPGFGDSSKPERATYTIQEQAERVHAFVQQLRLKRIHLAGNSMGGFIAANYASKYPDEVASLWLLDAAGTKAGQDSEVRRQFSETGVVPMLVTSVDDLPRVSKLVMSKPPFLPYCIERTLGERALANRALHERIFKVDYRMLSPLLDTFVTKLDVPALVIYGKEDRLINPKAADTFKAMMPNARVILMNGIGHVPMIEAPKRSADDYLQFRASLN